MTILRQKHFVKPRSGLGHSRSIYYNSVHPQPNPFLLWQLPQQRSQDKYSWYNQGSPYPSSHLHYSRLLNISISRIQLSYRHHSCCQQFAANHAQNRKVSQPQTRMKYHPLPAVQLLSFSPHFIFISFAIFQTIFKVRACFPLRESYCPISG